MTEFQNLLLVLSVCTCLNVTAGLPTEGYPDATPLTPCAPFLPETQFSTLKPTDASTTSTVPNTVLQSLDVTTGPTLCGTLKHDVIMTSSSPQQTKLEPFSEDTVFFIAPTTMATQQPSDHLLSVTKLFESNTNALSMPTQQVGSGDSVLYHGPTLTKAASTAVLPSSVHSNASDTDTYVYYLTTDFHSKGTIPQQQHQTASSLAPTKMVEPNTPGHGDTTHHVPTYTPTQLVLPPPTSSNTTVILSETRMSPTTGMIPADKSGPLTYFRTSAHSTQVNVIPTLHGSLIHPSVSVSKTQVDTTALTETQAGSRLHNTLLTVSSMHLHETSVISRTDTIPAHTLRLSTTTASGGSTVTTSFASIQTALPQMTTGTETDISSTLRGQIEPTSRIPGTTTDSQFPSHFPVWGWIVVAFTACLIASLVGIVCAVLCIISHLRRRGSYTVTKNNCEDLHRSLSSATQRHFLSTGNIGIPSQGHNGARGQNGRSSNQATTKTVPSQVKRSSSESAIMRLKGASFLHRSISRSSIHSLRLIDMKLDLAYSPEPTQTSTSFSRPPEKTKTEPHAATHSVEGEQLKSMNPPTVGSCSAGAPLSEDVHMYSRESDTVDMSDAMYDSDTDIPIHAV